MASFATITLEGIPTGGFFRVFDDGPVLNGDKVEAPMLVVVPGDPRRRGESLKAKECEYLVYDISAPKTWFAHEATMATRLPTQQFIEASGTQIAYVPTDRWGAAPPDRIKQYRLVDGKWVSSTKKDAETMQVLGTWDCGLRVRDPSKPARNDEEDPFYRLVLRVSRGVAIVTPTATHLYRFTPDGMFADYQYQDDLGVLHYPFMEATPISDGSPGSVIGCGRLVVDRELSPAEKTALASAWVADHSFIAEELSPVGLSSSKPLTWYRQPGLCTLIVTASLGWERGTTVNYVRSRPFQAEAGKQYRFRIRKEVHRMVAHLELEPVLPGARP